MGNSAKIMEVELAGIEAEIAELETKRKEFRAALAATKLKEAGLRSREEVAEFVNSGKLYEAGQATGTTLTHFGKVELRMLLDFIYGGPPITEAERVTSIDGD